MIANRDSKIGEDGFEQTIWGHRDGLVVCVEDW